MATTKYGDKEKAIIINALKSYMTGLDDKIANHSGEIQKLWDAREELQNERGVLDNAVRDIHRGPAAPPAPKPPKKEYEEAREKALEKPVVEAKKPRKGEPLAMKRIDRWGQVAIYEEVIQSIEQTYAGKTVRVKDIAAFIKSFFDVMETTRYTYASSIMRWMENEKRATHIGKANSGTYRISRKGDAQLKALSSKPVAGPKPKVTPPPGRERIPWSLAEAREGGYKIKNEMKHGICPHCGHDQKEFKYRLKKGYAKCEKCDRIYKTAKHDKVGYT